MPSRTTVRLSNEAIKILSPFSVDNNIRTHELADAIIVCTDWGKESQRILDYIRNGREKEESP
jgi:hypothetical protein